ncbi:MAG TPA: DUF1326 domain-containing protein [Ignavibacteriaceae bacterium]|nr:DUF1326 domain-containing protein [Ignavibacteriaceae bacterium]
MKDFKSFFALLIIFTALAVYAQTDQNHPKWHIKVNSLAVDNCPMTACSCLLGGMPYYHECHAVGIMEITEGNYGSVSLNGQLVGLIVDFHSMDKLDDMGFYIDKSASPEVKKALKEFLSDKPFGLVGEGYEIKEADLKLDYKSGQESSFSIGDAARMTLTPLMGGDGKSQISIKNPVDPFGTKEVFLNNGKGFYKDYGKNLTYQDNSGEIGQFELSSE